MKPEHPGRTSQTHRTLSSHAYLRRSAGIAVAALCCAPLTGGAQEASPAIEEIVVTAQRREQSLQDVPISVSAYGQEQMDVQGVRNIDDIANLAPGVTFTRGSGFGSDLGSSISIRGISSVAGTATTGVYIDETPIQVRATIASGNFSTNAYPRLFDVERVEVLRGPQGTLFGAGSEGGTVRFITPPPDLAKSSLYSRVEGSYTESGEPSYEAGVAGGVPLIQDRLAVRASASYRYSGGWIDRVSYETGALVDENANNTESLIARVALAFKATDNILITPSVLYQEIDNNDPSAFWLPSEDPSFNQPLTDLSDQRYESGARVQQYGDQDLTLAALKIDWNIGSMALISNTSYYDRSDKAVTDFTNFETPLWTSIFTGVTVTIPPDPTWIAPGFDTQDNEFFTQEIRLQSTNPDSRWSWVVGVFYSDQDTVTDRRVQNEWLPQILSPLSLLVPQIPDCTPATCYQTFFGVPAVDGKYIFVGKTSTNDKQLAGFGQVDYKINDHLTATVGLRYARLEFDFENVADGPVNGPPAPRTDTGSSEETATTPKVGLSYKTDAGTLFYASAAKGFRPGGANAPLRNPACVPDLAELGLTEVPLTYDSDNVWSYELGTKFAGADGAVQVSTSVFYTEWNDIINNFALDCILSFTTNLGEARSQGADLEVQWAITSNLLMSAAIGYTDANYTETLHPLINGVPNTAITLVEDGDALPGSGVSGHAAAQYSFDLTQQLPSYIRVDYSYQGKNDLGPTFNPSNPGYDPNSLFIDPSTNLLNARWGVNFQGVDVSLFVNNLLDSDPILGKARTYATAPLMRATTFRPRTIGLTGIYRF